jgi:hypothetical protein
MRILVSALMLLALVGADIAPPCDETEETLVEIQGNVSNVDSVKIYNNTNHENFENDDSNLFNSFQESESGGVWQGCLPKDACFMAEIGGEVDDELTFKQDGMLVETRFTFPDLNARTFKTFVELGDCIPTCDEVRGTIYVALSIVSLAPTKAQTARHGGCLAPRNRTRNHCLNLTFTLVIPARVLSGGFKMKIQIVWPNAMRLMGADVSFRRRAPAFIAFVNVYRQVNVICLSLEMSSITFTQMDLLFMFPPLISRITVSF